MQGCNILDNADKAMKVVSENDSLTIIDATNNYWGTIDSAEIEDMIFHNADISSVPTVDYVPFALDSFDIENSSPTAVGIEDNSILPSGFALEQNYPNPFNPITTIEFTLPNRSQVSLSIFNVLGQRISVLADRQMPAGTYSMEWNGRDSYGRPVSTGVYFYRLQAGDFTDTRKMVLLK